MSDIEMELKTARERVNFLEKKCAIQEREIQILRNALTFQTAEAEKSYRDLEESFDRVSMLVLNTVVHLVKVHKKPASYDSIIHAFKARYPFIDAKSETISRRVRELVRRGLLHSPSRGSFVPIAVKEVKT